MAHLAHLAHKGLSSEKRERENFFSKMQNYDKFIKAIPGAFWRSFAFQQICNREDLKEPKWSILCNENGIQVNYSLKWRFQGRNFFGVEKNFRLSDDIAPWSEEHRILIKLLGKVLEITFWVSLGVGSQQQPIIDKKAYPSFTGQATIIGNFSVHCTGKSSKLTIQKLQKSLLKLKNQPLTSCPTLLRLTTTILSL